ncbi:MAG: BatD family protein [Firmicutes bacterium]|nr:BatD family protein [Bacillota bacterium]
MSGCFRKKLLLTIITGIFSVLLMAANTKAAISASLNIEADSIQIGEQIRFNIEVNGTTSASQPDVKPIAGLNIQYLGPSTQVQIINLQTTSSVIFQYMITGAKAGQYTLGPYTIRAGGNIVKTNSIRLSVGGGGANSSSQNNQGHQNTRVDDSETQGPMGDRLFVTLDVPKKNLYYGERLPITVKFYISAGEVSIDKNISRPLFDQAEFVIDNLDIASQDDIILNGKSYHVVEFTPSISPVKPGTFQFGPAKITGTVIVRGPVGDIFEDFFGNFGGFERQPFEVSSKKITLHVLPLPEEGKPKDFSGGIGKFHFTVSASPTEEVLQGDPITVKMAVSGEGNLQVIAPPRLADTNGLKVYDAQRKSNGDQGAEVSFEQVVIPLDPNIKQIGPFTLNYFNPATGRYQQQTQGPIPVTVKPNPNFKAGAGWGDEGSAKKEEVGKDLVFIKDNPGSLEPKNNRLDRKPWFWLLQLLPLLGLAGAFQYRKRLEFLQADTAHSRAVRASSAASRRLAKIKGLLAAGELDNLLEELHQTLRGYLGEKFKLASAGMTGNVVEALKTKTIPGEVLTQIREFFDQYDFYRFTGAKLEPETARRLTDLTVAIITALDRLQPGRANARLPSIMSNN